MNKQLWTVKGMMEVLDEMSKALDSRCDDAKLYMKDYSPDDEEYQDWEKYLDAVENAKILIDDAWVELKEWRE